MESIHAVKLTIGQFMGIEEVAIELGKVTVITGENASGKSSIASAAIGVLEKGPDARKLRKGAEEGHVVYELSNGEKIDLRLRNGKGPDKTYRLAPTKPGKDGAARSRAQEAIEERFDVNSADLVGLMRANKAERYKRFLEAMPIELDSAEFAAILDGVLLVPVGLPALDALKQAEDAVYKMRADSNVLINDKAATIKTLRESLPPGEIDVATLQAKLDGMTIEVSKAATTKEAAKEKALAERDAVRESSDAAMRKVNDETNAELQATLAEIDERRQALDAEERAAREAAAKHIASVDAFYTGKIQEAIDAFRDAGAAALATYQEIESRVMADSAETRAKLEEAKRLAQTVATIATEEDVLKMRQAKAAKQDTVVKAIRAYRGRLLQTIPIPGVEMVNGDITIDGIEFDLVNLSRRIDVFVSLCELQAGPNGFIVIDDAEHFDSKNFKALCERCLLSKSRFLILRVEDTPLQVECWDGDGSKRAAFLHVHANGNGVAHPAE